jgi:hypothetical protein
MITGPTKNNRNGFSIVNSKVPFLLGLHGFVSGRDGSEKRACKLRWKAKFFSHSLVIRLRESVGINFFGFKNYFRKPIAGIQPIWEDLVGFMLTREFKLYGSYCFHIG